MALTSRQFKIATAVRSSVVADTDLIAAIPADQWRIQKRPYHRTQRWADGGHIVPMKWRNPPHENATLRMICPILVAAVWTDEAGLTDEQEARLGVQERIADIFAWNGRTKSPAPMVALNSALTGSAAFVFEQTFVEPGDSFMDSAFMAGLDFVSVVVNVQIVAAKVDYSTLGA